MPGPVKLPLVTTSISPSWRARAIAFGMHQPFAVDYMHIGPAFEHLLHDLTACEPLPRITAEYRHHPAALIYVSPENGEKTDSSIVVGKP